MDGKGFDFPIIDTLIEQFGLKPIRLTEWYGLTWQSIDNVLDLRPFKWYTSWTGKEMTESERNILMALIKDKKFDYSDHTVTCCCLNNRKDDLACLFIYEEEIKCFFLKELPEDLREMATSLNYHRYSQRELSGETDGYIVHVLKKPYFLPNYTERFRANARRRGISEDDYARFISGYPVYDFQSITDEQITAFFDENLVYGKVYISSDPKYRWIRSLASKNGYTIQEFIEFFGYVSLLDGTELTADREKECHIEALKKYVVHDNIVYLPANSNIYRVLETYCYSKGINLHDYIISLGFVRTTERPGSKADILEEDMQVRSVSSEAKFEEKVFGKYPLIGSVILRQEILEKLDQNTRKSVDLVLKQPHRKLTSRAEMQITLAVINKAKSWNSEENPNFWNYIALQLGYRDESGAVVRLLQNALENAMKKNHRLFFEDANGRSFKLTVLIHAFSTKKSWSALFDFLFDFYKNNLDWKIIPGDPLLELMICILQKKLMGESEEDAELTINFHAYSFQGGIRKLILLRPVFTRNLFEKLIDKIDAMINSKEMAVKTYEEQLCEEWFKEKVTAISNTKKTIRQGTYAPREVAIDYSRIRVKYILKNENNVQIVLPDTRLKREDVQRAVLVVYYDDFVALHQNLSWYGNELGKTLSGTSVTLPAYTGNTDVMNIRVKIVCDSETIFDSEGTMARRVLMFAAGNEVNTAHIHRGNYTLVVPAACHLEAENIDITEVDSFRTPGLRAYFLELKNGYMLTVDGRRIAFDSRKDTEIHVIPPSESASLPRVTVEDSECYLAYRDSTCTIILGNTDYKKQFIVTKNGVRIEFSDMKDTGNGLTFVCPLSCEMDFCRIQVINLGDERLVFERSFMLVSEAECTFDREFYFSSSDYKEASFVAKIDDYYEETAFAEEDDEVRLPFRNGDLHVDIPKIHIQETTGEWLNGQASVWFVRDIPQNSLLKVNKPAGTTVQFFVGGKDIMYDGQGLVTLGNVIQSFTGADDMNIAPVEMIVSTRKQNQRYLLTRVCYQECFLSAPEFWYEEGKLLWNHGGTFIGKQDRIFTLTLSGENDDVFEWKLKADTESMELLEDMPIGHYRFEISILTGSLFKKGKEVLAEGDCIIGDLNQVRFHRRRIKIDAITDEFNEEAGHIGIKKCYIDQIEFVGVEETSEGQCPVYTGVLFTVGSLGERYEFSFDKHVNKKGIVKMMVNPVRIIFVGDRTLCITDPEGDGLYYYHYYDKFSKTTVYALTDHEYTETNRQKYSTADLFSYRTERI